MKTFGKMILVLAVAGVVIFGVAFFSSTKTKDSVNAQKGETPVGQLNPNSENPSADSPKANQ